MKYKKIHMSPILQGFQSSLRLHGFKNKHCMPYFYLAYFKSRKYMICSNNFSGNIRRIK